MKHEEIMTRLGEIEQRSAEINTELEQDGVDLDALKEEARKLVEERDQLNTQLEELKEAAKKAEEARKAVENGAGKTTETNKEVNVMTLEELRNSKEYIDAYVNYIKTGKDEECRSLLTTNATAATGYVPVPTLVDDIVRHAWENEEILQLVRKTNFKGNVKVAFELSADGAYVHSEGAAACTEEALTLGIVEIKAENIKKWITISDEMMEETGEGFLRYVYEELAYQVAKKLSADIVDSIEDCAYTTNQSTAIGIPKLNKNPSVVTIPEAAANLSDEAKGLVIIMNRLTEVEFLKAHAAGNFAIDPFAGLPRYYTSALQSFSTCDANDTYAIVGDMSAVQVNFPDGDGLKLIQDPYSLAERDLVKIVGRVFAGHKVVAPGRLIRLTKEAGAVTT